MSRLYHYLLSFLFLFIPLGTLISQPDLNKEAIDWYHKAVRLYNDPNVTDTKDSLALSYFYKAIALMEKAPVKDSILGDSYLKAAIYEQTLGNFDKAIPLLQKNLRLTTTAGSVTPSTFLPNLYLANSFYMVGRYDSARYFYEQSAGIARQAHIEEGLERLYNAFGVMNYETGNYLQSRNNFENAVNLLLQKKDYSKALLVNFKSNLASALGKMELYNQALQVYENLLSYGQNTDELQLNMAGTLIRMGDFPEALSHLKKVKTISTSLLNSLGWAYYQSGNTDSASYYLLMAFYRNESIRPRRKNIEAGLTHYYLAEMAKPSGDWEKAIGQYQLSLQQFLPAFNESDVRSNPQSFLGSFAVSEIFETLLGKARAFRQLYKQTAQRKDLQSALDAYKTLYRLTDYAEKSYASDEARIFLNRKKYLSHDEPIETSIELYHQTGLPAYLEEAFYFDERNKASVLSNGISEKQLKSISHLPKELLSRETNLRESINAFSLKLSVNTDSSQQATLIQQIREKELALETITDSLNKYPEYARARFGNSFVNLKKLQSEVIPSDGAILSYHLGKDSLLTWLITPKEVTIQKSKRPDSLAFLVGRIVSNLRTVNNFSVADNKPALNYLYRLLVKPIENKLAGQKQLMIIPDDELNELPFEMLMDESDHYLLEKFAISYNYSCSLLTSNPIAETRNKNALAMAPFVPGSEMVENSGQDELAHSGEEIRGLQGTRLEGKEASKAAFLSNAGRYEILHLATHAYANDSIPAKSFIAFYPSSTDSFQNRLYLPEIYTLPLSSARLTILSACETGSGLLLKGEGIMGLSRAFSYAGCPNLVSSLWRADDAATSFINHRFRTRLQSGDNIAKCLQQARLDYLSDSKIDARMKTPAYWAHLRLTGVFSKPEQSNYLLWLSLVAAGIGIGIASATRRRKSSSLK